MEFLALDFETANADLASICQVGAVLFSGSEVADTLSALVDPEDYFAEENVAIHGITQAMVYGAPTFPREFEALGPLAHGRIVVSHTWFDRVALERASERYGLPELTCRWLDSARVVRRAWPERFARRGYGLASVAEWCGVGFEHHQADEDARAAGLVLIRAIEHTGISLKDWVHRADQPLDPSVRRYREGAEDGPLSGEVVVFTGALSVPRREAAGLAVEAGCDVSPSVGKKTTLVVVGQQDLRRLKGHERSSKHRKAEALIAKGQPLRILGEEDFRRLVQLY